MYLSEIRTFDSYIVKASKSWESWQLSQAIHYREVRISSLICCFPAFYFNEEINLFLQIHPKWITGSSFSLFRGLIFKEEGAEEKVKGYL